MIRAAGFFFALLFLSPAFGQQLLVPMPSTPDLSVSGTSTAEYSVRIRTARGTIKPAGWFAIKNDCDTTLYFAVAPNARGALDYPLRLGPGESFSMRGRLHSVGASNDGSSVCTFTLQAAE